MLRIKLLSSVIALVAVIASPLIQFDTLKQIYDLAKSNDASFRAAQASLRSGLQSEAIGRAGLLPNLNLNLSGQYSESLGERTVTQILAGEEDNFSSRYNATLSQSLFNMADWYNYRSGQVQASQAEYRWALAQQDLITRTTRLYLNVLRAIDDLETILAQKAALESQLEQTRQRFEVGLVPITDVLEAQAGYDSILASEFQARGNLGIAFEELTILTGQRHQSVAPLMEHYPIEQLTPNDPGAWVTIAAQNSNDLQIAELSRRAAEISARSSWTPYMPTLNGRVTYGGRFDNDSVGDSGAAVVSLEVPVVVFTGGSTLARRKQAYYNLEVAQENLLNTQRTLEQSVRSQHLTVSSSISLVRARLQAIRSAESALEATQAGYEVGTRNQVEVLNAQQNLFQARRAYLNSRYDYILAVLNLKATTGTLSEQDIEDLNRWLDASGQIPRNQFE